MTLIPIAPSPGICLSDTSYAVGKDLAYVTVGGGSFRQGQGRWSAGYNIEFIAGFPQKIAGWSAATTQTLLGVPRNIKVWRDNTGLARVMIGTTQGLFQWQPGSSTVPVDVTPLRTLMGGTLNNAITTVNGSPTISIADINQVLQNGDWVLLSAASAVGGVTVNGWYSVQNRTSTGYQISSLVVPTGSGTGGGIITFQYPRENLSGPFSTTAGSSIVTVTDAAGVATVGGFVIFSNALPFSGVLLNGKYQIISTSGMTYTINANSNATGTATNGGGNTVSTIYPINITQSLTSSLNSIVWGQTGIVWGQAGQAWGTSGFVAATLPDGWCLSEYGSQMLCQPIGGTIYVYDPAYQGRAYPLLNAPLTMNASFVTPERFVVALGVNNNLLQIAWADENDYTQWVTTATNTANTGRAFSGGSYFVGGIGVRNGVSLIFTNTTVFELNYTGGQEIYSSPQIGDNCGLVSPTALVEEGGMVYWMSDQDWWSWNGAVSILPSDDVRDSVFRSGINRPNLGKATCSLNRAKRQVRFFWPGPSSAENNTGMIYQYDQQCFGPLSFGRSCGTDAELLSVPISMDTSTYVFYDETGVDANGSPLTYQIQLGLMDIENGGRNADIFGVIPDFQTLVGNSYFTALSAYYPSDALRTDGPWTITNTTERIDLRLDGKLFSFMLLGTDLGATMRLGVNRLDVQPSGARR